MIQMYRQNILSALTEDIPEKHALCLIYPNSIEYLSSLKSSVSEENIFLLAKYGTEVLALEDGFGVQNFYSIRNGASLLLIDYVSPIIEHGGAVFLEIFENTRHPTIYHHIIAGYATCFLQD